MKSIKPGRGPSMMGAVGSVFAIVFGIIWTGMAAYMGAPFFFPLFGLVFIGMGVVNAVYNFKNATSKNRYSSFDITEDGEEPDPLNARFSGADSEENAAPAEPSSDAAYCPFCGEKLEKGYSYCPKCGSRLP